MTQVRDPASEFRELHGAGVFSLERQKKKDGLLVVEAQAFIEG
jgi:hypothetical protein